VPTWPVLRHEFIYKAARFEQINKTALSDGARPPNGRVDDDRSNLVGFGFLTLGRSEGVRIGYLERR
jgi:hypothetical protein